MSRSRVSTPLNLVVCKSLCFPLILQIHPLNLKTIRFNHRSLTRFQICLLECNSMLIGWMLSASFYLIIKRCLSVHSKCTCC
ncbi:hypothetical protein QVD17_07131 [Tagetes erecta]|uniref:Uncharacterized protein n=1 Tax=Tagetes erecta TaxID=13708 RepID=A0AAD8P775_TARER|nr:hypothetical protein QVD17_07131 [Tagetes erecta]